MSENQDNVFSVPEHNLEHLQKMVDRISRKSMKLTGEPINMVVFGFEMKKIAKYKNLDGSDIYHKFYDVLLDTEIPNINGWDVVAKLEHITVDGAEEVLVKTSLVGHQLLATTVDRYKSGFCEHCGTRRKRNDTFILKSKDGELKQVGRTCLGDFTGANNPAALAKRAEMVFDLIGHITGVSSKSTEIFNETGVTPLAYRSTVDYLAAVSYVMATDNGVFYKKPMVYDQSTSERALRIEHSQTNESHTSIALKTIAFMNALPDSAMNDFKHNVKTVVSSEYIAISHTGLAAWAVYLYLESTKVRTKSTSYVGEIGKTVKLTATVTKVLQVNSPYGSSNLVKFDVDGACVVGFHPGDWDVGCVVDIEGIVSKHEEYRGEKQTTLKKICRRYTN